MMDVVLDKGLGGRRMNGTQAIILIVALATVGALAYRVVSTRRKALSYPKPAHSKATVTFDDERVVCEVAGHRTEMRWDDLIGVALETTDQGPAVDDVFFILSGPDGVLVCPSEAEGGQDLLARLQQLPGFDNEAVISAMSCTETRTFICWDHKGRYNKASEAVDTGAPKPQR
jgi:hypothetical protein